MKIIMPPILEALARYFKVEFEKAGKAMETLQPFFDEVKKGLDGVGKAFEAFRDALGKIKLPNPFQPLLDASAALRKALGGSPSAPSTVPGASQGGALEGFASGTNFFPGGLAWVGEQGPELISAPRGSKIYDATTSAQLSGGRTLSLGGISITVPIQVADSAENAARVAQDMASSIIEDTMRQLGNLLESPRMAGA